MRDHYLKPQMMATLAPSSSDRKQQRYGLLEFVRSNTSRVGGRKCMFALGATVSVVSGPSGVARVGGVQRCGSVWACPVCAPTIRENRAAEIDTALGKHLASGGLAYFLTSTVRHSAGTPLADTLRLVQAAWSDAWRPASLRKKQRGYLGQIRAVEITHGRNGWHPHLHSVVLFEAGTTTAAAESVLNGFASNWSTQLQRRGATCGRSGVDYRPVIDADGVSKYLAKVEGGWGAGLELARGDLKTSKGTTPSQFLARAAAGEVFALKMWSIYETATLGKRQLVWSRGLKARFDIADISDIDAAEVVCDELPTLLVIVPARHWHQMLRAGKIPALLDAVGSFAQTGDLGLWDYPPGWLNIP